MNTIEALLALSLVTGCSFDSENNAGSLQGRRMSSDGQGQLEMISSSTLPQACSPSPQLGAQARTFMLSHGLSQPGDEITEDDNLGIVMKWALHATTLHGDVCLLTMKVCTADTNSTDLENCKTTHEVLARKNGTIMHIEEALRLPTTARFAVAGKNSSDSYFVEVSGASVIAGMKLALTNFDKLPAFHGIVTGGGKVSFDPTPNRGWRVRDPQIDLRIYAASPEGLDMHPQDFDNNWEDSLRGCFPAIAADGTRGCEVSPWTGGVRLLP